MTLKHYEVDNVLVTEKYTVFKRINDLPKTSISTFFKNVDLSWNYSNSRVENNDIYPIPTKAGQHRLGFKLPSP